MCHVEMLGVKNLMSLSINDQLTEKLGLLDPIIIKKKEHWNLSTKIKSEKVKK